MTRKMKDSGIEWIGEIPVEWRICRHKNIMRKEKVICEHYNNEDIISLTMSGVIVRNLNNGGKMPTTFDGYQYVEPLDLLLCLFDIDVTPRCVGLVKNYGITSPAYSKFKLKDGLCSSYYDYLLRTIDDKKVFVHLAKNLRSSLTENDFGVLPTIVPPLSEQRCISRFLDSECAKIDRLIEQTRASIEEYKKLKQAMITEAVTKGVRGKRKMKDSGIPWIGEIPEEWEVKKLKYCSTFVQEKCYVDDESTPYLGLENVGSWNGQYLSTESEFDKSQSILFCTNDILFGKLRPYLAKVFHAKENGCCSSEFCVIRIHKEYDVRFFWNLLISSEFVRTVDQSTYGIKMPRANTDYIKNLMIPVPPSSEQRRIASFLDNRSVVIDSIMQKKERTIIDLLSYKKSLIYEYVTGKKEVPA